MTSTDTTRFNETERNLLQWLIEHGGAHEPLPVAWPALKVVADEIRAMEDGVEEAYDTLVDHGLAQPMDDTLDRVFRLLPVDAVTNLCGCPHDPDVWPTPYGAGNGAIPPRLP